MATYFFDACISPKLVAMLVALGTDHQVLHMFSEGFDRDMKDVDLIPAVAKRGNLFVTCDNAQRRKLVEKVLREQVKISTVFLWGGFSSLMKWPQARWIINHWEQISKETCHFAAGDTFLVKQSGKVEKL